ncbi:hypothetical protein [Sinosporangium siamense]|uniref:Serine peptidase n=1 Tax=Sinosporangium siamense TaxID=1367973 RepID=A0A919RE55_9ACTN|nr:hypothetical protein [Sinosporangium siamense]GII90129.1 hypothetical protein Ssi02_03600 [Sinosporangium siamense]
MTRIIGVHGIGNYSYMSEHGTPAAAAAAISADWSGWLSRGDTAPSVDVAYYAHLLHRGTAQGSDDVTLLEPGEQELLVAMVDLLAGVPQTAQGRATARVRQAGEWLTENHGRAAKRLAVMFVREVNTYLHLTDECFRDAARDMVAESIRSGEGGVVVAHSLGSVVTYEALWAHPELKVDLLVTLGSPLGMNQVVFQRLRPGPAGSRCARPPGVRRWINLADVGDLIAVPADLRMRFDDVEQADPLRIARFEFHKARNYLASPRVRELVTIGA